jgi:hypothetical protein
MYGRYDSYSTRLLDAAIVDAQSVRNFTICEVQSTNSNKRPLSPISVEPCSNTPIIDVNQDISAYSGSRLAIANDLMANCQDTLNGLRIIAILHGC